MLTRSGTSPAVVIFPQVAWHGFEAPDDVSLMITTLRPAEHLTFASTIRKLE
jgi:hypothetical protein